MPTTDRFLNDYLDFKYLLSLVGRYHTWEYYLKHRHHYFEMIISMPMMKNFKQIPLLHALTFQWHSNTLNCFQHSQFLLHSVTFNSSKWSHDRGHQLSRTRTKLSSTLSMTAASDISDEFSSRQNQRGSRRRKIAVIGGGASGMFAATAAADAIQKYGASTDCDVIVYEGTSKTMSKVRISGGGRVSLDLI